MDVTSSFDVFDTVLVRVWAAPRDLFLEVGSRLATEKHIPCNSETWRQWRERAQECLYRSGEREPTLQAIYDEIGRQQSISPSLLERAKGYEIEAESGSVRVNPALRQLIEQEHAAGWHVLYLSDMYLPAGVIERMLKEAGVWSAGDKLYVSCEIGASKFTGALYKYCLEREGLTAAQLRHFGDHEYSDVRVPRTLGIDARPVRETRLNKNEQFMLSCEGAPTRLMSLVAGASRLARLDCIEEAGERKTIWNAGASVVGPAFLGFVAWCLSEAAAKNLRRLYFVARDGQIMLRMAQAMAERWVSGVECRYLHGSRHAWFLPSVDRVRAEDWGWILDDTHFLSVTSVCKRVDLDPVKIGESLTRHGLQPDAWQRNLMPNERARLRSAMGEGNVLSMIEEQAAIRRLPTIGYLHQEGLDDGTPYGIVDIGWNGRLQWALTRLLRSANMFPSRGLDGFYFCIRGRSGASPQDRRHAFFYDESSGPCRQREELCQPAVIELFAAADHGGVTGYQGHQGTYQPVLNATSSRWLAGLQQSAAVAFTKHLTEVTGAQDHTAVEWASITESALRAFLKHPTLEEATVYGGQHIEEDQAGGGALELAPPYGVRHVARFALTGLHQHHCVWVGAVRRRSSRLVRLLLSEGVLQLRARLGHLGAVLHWYTLRATGVLRKTTDYPRHGLR